MVIQQHTAAAAEILTAGDLVAPVTAAPAAGAAGHIETYIRLADKGITILGQMLDLVDRVQRFRGSGQAAAPAADPQQYLVTNPNPQPQQYLVTNPNPQLQPPQQPQTMTPTPQPQPQQQPQQQPQIPVDMPEIDIEEIVALVRTIDEKMPGITVDQFGGLLAYILQNLQLVKSVFGGDVQLSELADTVERVPGMAARVMKFAARKP